MKKTIKLLLLVMLCVHITNAQEKNEMQLITDALHKTVAYYVDQNLDIKIPEIERQKIINDAKLEGLNQKSIDQVLLNYKKQYLRHQFYKNNPSLEKQLKEESRGITSSKGLVPTPSPRCISEGFEGTINGFGLTIGRTEVSCGANSLNSRGFINLDPNNIPVNANATIVGSGNDPIVASAGHTLTQVKSGLRSLRINQNVIIGTENDEVDVVSKSILIEEDELTFDFASVLELPTNTHTNSLPYFKYSIVKKGVTLISDCYMSNDSRLNNTIFNTQGERFVFNQWESVSVDVSNYVGQIVRIVLETADCGQGAHGGYTYIDNIRNCTPTPPCPTPNDIHFINEGGGGLCTTGQASLSGINNSLVDQVDWTWALGGHSGTGASTGTTSPIYYPSGDWTNYYISICATVTYTDGSTCTKVCKSFLLDCGDGVGDPIGRTSVYPNPTNDLFSLETNSKLKVQRVVIKDLQGTIVKSVIQKTYDNIQLAGERKGIYIVEITYEDGSLERKKVVLQ
ncbi:T9SS type A sorting domain-containing protein [uncultured Aquimarina sp.]|uniref:T9SS type A sorting domain-containing protein n=1 Tax=uncultured Aquimarina sp. TaxID=575652 RepID=UPI00261F9B54|nr:T9SS type A sorting domain-containing protein [uncultured Aquimarina sp.]